MVCCLACSGTCKATFYFKPSSSHSTMQHSQDILPARGFHLKMVEDSEYLKKIDKDSLTNIVAEARGGRFSNPH